MSATIQAKTGRRIDGAGGMDGLGMPGSAPLVVESVIISTERSATPPPRGAPPTEPSRTSAEPGMPIFGAGAGKSEAAHPDAQTGDDAAVLLREAVAAKAVEAEQAKAVEYSSGLRGKLRKKMTSINSRKQVESLMREASDDHSII